jgi:iron complex transport system substrate-binding protein
LLETVYEQVLKRDLERRGLRAARQVPVSFDYDGMKFEEVCRVDLLIEGCIVVEIKSVERLAAVHPKQLPTYLRLLKLPLGCSSISVELRCAKAFTVLRTPSPPPRLRGSA